MELDLLFPAVVSLVLLRSLLLVQVSDREKQWPADLTSSQDALHIKVVSEYAEWQQGATKWVKEATEEEEEDHWGLNGLPGDLLTAFIVADWDETAAEVL